MSTKVYLDLVRSPPGVGKGVPLPLQMSSNVRPSQKIMVFIMN